MRVSGIGIWNAGLRFKDPGETAEAAAELEELGYTSLWVPDFGGGMFDAAERLLSATRTIVVASGILNLWMYTADEVAAGCDRVLRGFGDRFLLGIGVSHASLVEAHLEGVRYERPLRAMGAFLDGLDAADPPVRPAARVLAALGPKMLELAGRRAGGAHPYNVTPEHTAAARSALGPSKLLVPEQAVVCSSDPVEVRRLGREFLQHYLSMPNYTNNLRRLGFTDDDFADNGSDRLIDALVAWGDPEAIAARVRAHKDAGADSVCVQVLSEGGMVDLPRAAWRELAPALTVL